MSCLDTITILLPMHLLAGVAGFVLVAVILVDAFELILQPRRVTHRFRFGRLFYRVMWWGWRTAAGVFTGPKARQAFLSGFGPLSLLSLFATWIAGLILSFAILHWSFNTALAVPDSPVTFWTYLYLSGTTFFTLGYGDITPLSAFGRVMAVIESGLGFGFLAVVITYLPVLYQAYSQREIAISLLDARAGSPPSPSQLLARAARSGNLQSINGYFIEWERWSAELLESHLSFPVLSFFRSQHDNQSWLAALTTMLDTSAIVLAEVKSVNPYHAQLAFAIARHAVVDLALVLKIRPIAPKPDRLPADQQAKLREMLRSAGIVLHDEPGIRKLAELRGLYEPFVNALSQFLLFTLPPIVVDDGTPDNWQRSAWMRGSPDLRGLTTVADDQHFD